MCGRYVSPDEASIEREFTLVRAEWQFPPSYNVAPTQNVPVVRVNKAGERTGALLHWGLIPHWAKGVQPKFSTINATVEKIIDAATWRGAWKRGQRCTLPALVKGIYPSQAHPGPTRQVLSCEMQVSPQAFPFLQILQHAPLDSCPPNNDELVRMDLEALSI
jgi:SOS response associated peptidase (SRAP)